jgi:formamidopyrimidine-DNA glycosylase
MPELPDVEIFKRYLDATSLHQKIETTQVLNQRILSVSAKKLQRDLKGKTLASTFRHGKYLFVKIEDGAWLIFHFGMSGRLKYYKRPEKKPSHTRLLISFSNDYHLAYDSQRKLGKISICEDPGKWINEKSLGPDAVNELPDFSDFQKTLSGRQAMVKSTLMNQEIIAGIGNIYADEILYQAGVHPRSKIKNLKKKTLEMLFHTMKDVLQTAIDRKADPEQFPDTYLLPNRNKEGRCPKCGKKISRTRVSGRTTYYCRECQGK